MLDLKSGELVQEDLRSTAGASLGYEHPRMTPDGKYLFTLGSEELHRFRLDGTKLVYEQSSPRIASGAIEGICVSPDSQYVCIPSGGGNTPGLPNHPPIRTDGTYIYRVEDLSRPAFTLNQGAYPKCVGFDPAAGLVYSQNAGHKLIVFSAHGVKQKEYAFGQSSIHDVRQYLIHPIGRKLLLHQGDMLSWVALP